MRWFTLVARATFLSLLWCSFPLLADENLHVIDVEVNSDQGQPAIIVNFNQSIRYRGVLPNRPAREFDIQLQKQLPVVQGDEPQESRREKITVPKSEGAFLDNLDMVIEGDDVHLALAFSKVVNLRVGQFSGTNSVTIILQKETLNQNAEELKTNGAENTDEMMAAGKRALRLGDNALAIRIFNNLISLPDNPHSRDALELLGLARERNNQLAQAKLIYQQYLAKYQKNDDERIRVKQRLADLLEVKQKPQQKLEKTGKKIHKTFTLTTFSQYFYRGLTSIEGQSSASSESQLNSRFSYLWRKRDENREVKHYFYAYNLYDFESRDRVGLISSSNEDIIISSAYSRIKDREQNYAMSLGRQTSQGGGVLGRYDGLEMNYGIANKIKWGINVGAPVGIANKDRIQFEKKFISAHVDFDDLIKDWNFSGYGYSQTQDGFTDRQSVGGEVRYFADGISLFSLLDYDVYFSQMTIYLMRLQSKIGANDTFVFNVDSRRLVEVNNALINGSETSLQQISAIYSEDQVKENALANTPTSSLSTLGWIHSFQQQWEANVDYTKGVTVLNDRSSSAADSRSIYKALNLLVTKNGLIQQNDLLFLSFRFSTSDSSDKITDDSSAWVSHRLLFTKYRFLSKLKVSHRSDSDGGLQNIISPSFKINYKLGKDNDLEFEAGIDKYKYGGSSIGPDFTYSHFNLGYQLYF